ncbi:MAG: hypothetical protein J6X88_03625 [Bacteroidales bacterium]|nr:hypothetical protein [Bacteroidales bacterium]
MSRNLKTQIPGLDILLNWDDDDDENANQRPEELLIVLRGDRGISKVNLAMQMMIGIAEHFGTERLPRFYSLDKDNKALKIKYKNIKGDDRNIESLFPQPKRQDNSYLYSKLLQFNAIVQDMDKISSEKKLPCIVIEGFAGLSMEEFARLPMATLEEQLRDKVHVAILVFDNRLMNYGTGAEIIIEMRRSFNAQHNYTHYELQIVKNFLRTATHGWHNYRCDDMGRIIVYPSLHKLLSKKQQMRSRFEEVLGGSQKYSHVDHDVLTKKEVTIQDVFCPKGGTITGIVGANNTYKRRLAVISVIAALKQNNQVLVMLFNERRTGFMDLLSSIDRNYLGNSNLHLLEVPMGCLSQDEFIDFIQRYIKQYKQDRKTNVHLYMIDLVAFDYAFPMLQSETLFLPALTTICKSEETSLTMVCNKKFSLVDEVCFVSDTVMCTERENGKDPNGLTIYLEKNPFGHEQNSRVFKMDIADVTANADLLLSLRFDTEICTTKDFWRQAWNVHPQLSENIPK